MGRCSLLAIVCFGFACPLPVCADEVDDVRHFDTVKAKIQKVLPKGWHVTEALSDESKEIPRGAMQYPRLEIRSDEPLMATYVRAAAPPRNGPDDGYEPKIVEITIWSVRYVAPQRFVENHRINEESQRQRERFAKRVRSIIDVQDKSWKRPYHVHAETVEQLQARREYAFLYWRTEPIDLPTHHYQSLSFSVYPDYYELRDKGKDAELHQLYEHLDHILTPYRVPEDAQ